MGARVTSVNENRNASLSLVLINEQHKIGARGEEVKRQLPNDKDNVLMHYILILIKVEKNTFVYQPFGTLQCWTGIRT